MCRAQKFGADRTCESRERHKERVNPVASYRTRVSHPFSDLSISSGHVRHACAAFQEFTPTALPTGPKAA